jgi:hypothetical protein
MTRLRASMLALVCLVVMLFQGAAYADDELRHVNSAAIVSVLGDVMFFERRGWTAFGNRLDQLPIENWAVDERIGKALSLLLANRFQLHRPPAMPPGSANCVGVQECAQLLPRTSEFDAYILVTKSVSPGLGFGRDFTGIGVFRGPGIFGHVKAIVHVVYDFAIVDARTAKVIAVVPGKLSETVFGGEHAWPVADLDASDWPDSPSTISEEVKTQIEQAVVSLVDGSLPYTAKQLGL